MRSKKPFVILWALIIVLFPLANASHANLMNGDFSDGLNGWDDGGMGVDVKNGYATLKTQGYPDGPAFITLSQGIEIPEFAFTLSFDIGIKPDGYDGNPPYSGFPDFIQVYYYDYITDLEYVDGVSGDTIEYSSYDRYFVSINSTDPSSPPYHPITEDDLVLEPFNRDGLEWYHFVADISDLAGRAGVLFFDLYDNDDGSISLAYVDNVSINPVPEPATLILLGSGLAALTGLTRRKRKFS